MIHGVEIFLLLVCCFLYPPVLVTFWRNVFLSAGTASLSLPLPLSLSLSLSLDFSPFLSVFLTLSHAVAFWLTGGGE